MENAQKDFEDFLQRYCKTYNVNTEEAKKHKLVQDVRSYYFDDKYKDTILC